MANLPTVRPNTSVIGPADSDATLLGREALPDGRGGDKVQYGGELHHVLFGPNGVGKGMRVLVPNLLSIVGKSIVVIDPKGQLAAMTAKFRHQAGDDVKIIDPFGVLAEVVREWERTFCIITVPANELVGAIHDRMPAIVPIEQHSRWLGTEPDPRDLLQPFPADQMKLLPR